MLASSFFFGRNVREKRERDQKAAFKEAITQMRNFHSDFLTDEYLNNGRVFLSWSLLQLIFHILSTQIFHTLFIQ